MGNPHNPIASWRGRRSLEEAAWELNLSQDEYLTLESHPSKSFIKSNDIIAISHIAEIPLAVLVDYLTETNRTKEMA